MINRQAGSLDPSTHAGNSHRCTVHNTVVVILIVIAFCWVLHLCSHFIFPTAHPLLTTPNRQVYLGRSKSSFPRWTPSPLCKWNSWSRVVTAVMHDSWDLDPCSICKLNAPPPNQCCPSSSLDIKIPAFLIILAGDYTGQGRLAASCSSLRVRGVAFGPPGFLWLFFLIPCPCLMKNSEHPGREPGWELRAPDLGHGLSQYRPTHDPNSPTGSADRPVLERLTCDMALSTSYRDFRDKRYTAEGKVPLRGESHLQSVGCGPGCSPQFSCLPNGLVRLTSSQEVRGRTQAGRSLGGWGVV